MSRVSRRSIEIRQRRLLPHSHGNSSSTRYTYGYTIMSLVYGISHYAACRDDERNAESQQHQTKNDMLIIMPLLSIAAVRKVPNSDTGPAHGPAAAYRLIVRGPLAESATNTAIKRTARNVMVDGSWSMNQSVHTLKVTSIHKIVKINLTQCRSVCSNAGGLFEITPRSHTHRSLLYCSIVTYDGLKHHRIFPRSYHRCQLLVMCMDHWWLYRRQPGGEVVRQTLDHVPAGGGCCSI